MGLSLCFAATSIMVSCTSENEETIKFNEHTIQMETTAILYDLMQMVNSCRITFTGQLFIGEDYDQYLYYQTNIASVGKVDDVSYITTKPKNRSDQVEADVGNGYVARNEIVGPSHH